jgi:antitoxin component of MazEF toxin-antitoxin module
MIYLLKVIALGSSRAIVLPAPLLSALDVDRGDIVAIRSDKPNSFRFGRAPAEVLRPATEQNVIALATFSAE